MNTFDYKKLYPFKWFVLQNFPFLEDDFDALTNWQLFCKLGNQINKLIDSENELGEQVENVTNAFIALQEYVNNYFDNLDIQGEIDSKLDEMADSGELAEIISQYIQMQGLLCYDTVADMKSATNMVNGSFAKTYGFYSVDDGGDAFYKIRTVTNEDVINEMDIIAITNDNTLVAELVTNIANPLKFGAKGDGTSDDTDFLQRASYYAQDKQIELYIPEKIYKSNALTFTLIPIITIKGTISAIEQDTEFLFDYGGVNTAPIININKFTNHCILKVLGIESGEMNIRSAYKLLLTTDVNTERRHTSQCYNTFNLGFINQLEIYPNSEGGYINENLFIGGRFANIYLHTNSNYSPSENTFMKCFSEDTVLTIDSGKNNIFYDLRAENLSSITCGSGAYGNVFYRNWGSRTGVTMRAKTNPQVIAESLSDSTVDLGGKNMLQLNYSQERLAYSINKFNNPKNLTTTGTLNETLLCSSTNTVYKTQTCLLPDVTFGLTFVADNKNFKHLIQFYDSSGNLVTTDPEMKNDSPLFTWDSTNHGYATNSTSYYANWIMITPNSSAKYMKITTTGVGSSTKGFNELKCYFNYYTEPKFLNYILKALDTPDNT